MNNTYLKKFMPLTWASDPRKITITFLAEIYNDQTLDHALDRVGDGYVLCMYHLSDDPKILRKKLHLEKHVHEIVLSEDWLQAEYPDHVTTLVLLHNPGSDHDSMRTSDTPTIPL